DHARAILGQPREAPGGPAAGADDSSSDNDTGDYASAPGDGGYPWTDPAVTAQGMTRSEYASYMRQGPAADSGRGTDASQDPPPDADPGQERAAGAEPLPDQRAGEQRWEMGTNCGRKSATCGRRLAI